MTSSNRPATRETMCKLQVRCGRLAVLLAAFAGCRDSTTQTAAIAPTTATATAEAAEAAAPTGSAPPAATSAPTPATSAAPSPSVAARIKSTFGERCHFERACGALWGIDCDAAVDGPYYYVKADTLEKVASCGGFCMGGRCTNCPPKEWSCTTY